MPHPFKDRLDQGRDAICTSDLRFQSVPTLRDVVSTFKIEKFRGARPTFPQAWFDYATSIQSVKAAELRKAVKLAFRALDLQKVEKMGGGTLKYVCRVEAQEIEVDIDYGGRSAQLRYQVTPAQLRGRGVFGWLTLERSLGLGAGDWDRITEDNLAASLEALCDCVRYAASLPARVEAWAVSDAP